MDLQPPAAGDVPYRSICSRQPPHASPSHSSFTPPSRRSSFPARSSSARVGFTLRTEARAPQQAPVSWHRSNLPERRGEEPRGSAQAPLQGHSDQPLAEVATADGAHKPTWSPWVASQETEKGLSRRGGTWSPSPGSEETRPAWLGFVCFPLSPGRGERRTLMSLICSLIFPRLDKAGGWATAFPPLAVFP